MNESAAGTGSEGSSQPRGGHRNARRYRGPRRVNNRPQQRDYPQPRVDVGSDAAEPSGYSPSTPHLRDLGDNSRNISGQNHPRFTDRTGPSRSNMPEPHHQGFRSRGARHPRFRGVHRSNPISQHASYADQHVVNTEVESQNEPGPIGSSHSSAENQSPTPARNRVINPNTARNVQSEISENKLKNNKFECLICCDIVNRSNPIWYCNNCYNIFHLKCAIEWCNKSINSRQNAIANAQYPALGLVSGRQTHRAGLPEPGSSNHNEENHSRYSNQIEWPCPTCREVLYSRPNKYRCFCGKVTRPEINRRLTPHSCGQICGRKRPNSDCPHNCDSLCHPGRCLPCIGSCDKTCHCGKVTKNVQCSEDGFSCDQVCGKSLLCGSHSCDKLCHTGPCSPCGEILQMKCYCGLQEIFKACIEFDKAHKTNFSCGRLCQRPLDCSKHLCQEKCHPGPKCRSCKLLSENIKTCPCGSNALKKTVLLDRKSCTDPIPTCESKCNRPLNCGPEKNRHKCQRKCHTGTCPPCKLKTTIHCDCKQSTRTVECSALFERVIMEGQVVYKQIEYSFSCETRCNKLRNCGRHRCNNKCCKFTKTQDLTLHQCEQMCNKKLQCGQHQCPEPCHSGQCGDCTNIGWEELSCHCGSSVLFPPIPCGAQTPVCHNPCVRRHGCNHPVKHECHDETEKCAPCIVFMNKFCFCGSESKDSVYCYLVGYSCGKTCRKLLACRQHTCQKVCHDGECEIADARGAILCNRPCPVLRFSCKHPCALPCHGKAPCPPSECRKFLPVQCECGNKSEKMECFKVMKDADNINMVSMLSRVRANDETIMIDLSKGPVKKQADSSNLIKLDCDESCSLYKRNKALAEALEINQPDLKPASLFGDDPLRLLKEATVQDYKFVAATYNSLVRFVRSSKESDKRFIFMQFPPSSKLRREVIHELAHHFHCTSESQEEEPFRHVVVRAYKNKSIVPEFNIEQLLPVTD